MQNFEGKTIDHYQVLEPLGKGGMAIVYRAFDLRLNRHVAIKLIRTEAIPAEQHTQLNRRFEREAISMAKLSHPNIIPVHDYGEFEGVPYLVMDYLPGGTLKQYTGQPVDYRQAAALLVPVAEALAYAHTQGVIHRDVKPANILITQAGHVMLSDFGIAKLMQDQDATALTGTGSGVGTPQYMAPEQWKNQVSSRTDIYALGIILYELITGRKPYDADTPAAIAIMQATEPLPRPKLFIPSLPDSVEKVLLKALALNPENRFSSMAEFAAVLTQLSLGDEATPSEPFEEPEPAKKRNLRGLLAGIAVFLVVAAFAGVFWILPQLREPAVPTQPPATHLSAATTQPAAPTETVEPTKTSTLTSLPTDTPTLTPEILGIGSSFTRAADGMLMMYVPAGEFTMGSDNGFDDQKPEHPVYLDAYWIDYRLISWEQYNLCIEAGACEAGEVIPSFEGMVQGFVKNESYTYIMVGNASWFQAEAYCAWAGGRLLTEAEWERAARDEAVSSQVIIHDDASCVVGNEPVCGDSLDGVMSEWVSDWYNASYYYESPYKNPRGLETGVFKSIREYLGGGSAYRHGLRPGDFFGNTSFRCAKDVSGDEVLTIKSTPTPQNTATPTPTATPATDLGIGSSILREQDGMEMMYVPAGSFLMGSDDGNTDEQPAHEVFLDAYWIDKFEVSSSQYAECVNAEVCSLPKNEDHANMAAYVKANMNNTFPIVNVNWYQALFYCEWVGGRLPTEAEWENSAHSGNNGQYPWDSEKPSCEMANFDGCSGQADTVNSRGAGASGYMVVNLAGNVSEWVSDWYGSYDYAINSASNPTGSITGDYRVVRGGSFNDAVEQMVNTKRSREYPFNFRDYLGFRCVMDAD
ncbi:MAG: SUMF1/EgtB/PvdO family nonheme iron enzyme [Anaerolineae bacterium]|nr:SUMF1/EgtB/PvdO family nonheme iron enzyme [Anaerolineae bacterium]